MTPQRLSVLSPPILPHKMDSLPGSQELGIFLPEIRNVFVGKLYTFRIKHLAPCTLD